MQVYTPDKQRIFFEAEQSGPLSNDAECVVSTSGDGCVRIAVADDKAVDSYNYWFDCSIKLSPEQTRQLFVWFSENFTEAQRDGTVTNAEEAADPPPSPQ